jgi:hypothetical protein
VPDVFVPVPTWTIRALIRHNHEANVLAPRSWYAVRVNPGPPERIPFSTRFLNLVLEGLKLFGIALAALLVIAIAVFVSVKTGIIIPRRWFGFCVWTGLLIWSVCRLCKRHRRRTKFWLAFAGLLAVHVMAFVVVLRTFPDWGLGWFMPIFLVEAPLMVVLLETVATEKSSRNHPFPPSTA